MVKLSSLGDVVHAMPAVQDIRHALPLAQIDWVVERSFAPLVRRCTGVHRVIGCDLRCWCKSPLSRPTRHAWGLFKAELQREPYDAVIDLQGLTKSALVSWLAQLSPNGKRYSLANQTEGSCFEVPTRWVADVAISMQPHIHAVARSRELCSRALQYTLPLFTDYGLLAHTGQVDDAIADVATKTGMSGVVALVHGSSRTDKQWPLSHWLDVGMRLYATGYAVALLHGNALEEQTAHTIASHLPQAQVWPRLNLDTLIDALTTCTGVIGVDSGLSHIAVALNLPHVQLYNFDTAWRTGPVPISSSQASPLDQSSPRQCSVFAQPFPAPDAVWQAWLNVLGSSR